MEELEIISVNGNIIVVKGSKTGETKEMDISELSNIIKATDEYKSFIKNLNDN